MESHKKDLINLIKSCGKTVTQAALFTGTNRQTLYDHRGTAESLPFEQVAKLSQFLKVDYINIVGEQCKLS